MNTTRHRAKLRRQRQDKRLLIASESFSTNHISPRAGKEWVLHGGNIGVYKRAWPVGHATPKYFNQNADAI